MVMADQNNNSNNDNAHQHQGGEARLDGVTPLNIQTQSTSSSRPTLPTAQPTHRYSPNLKDSTLTSTNNNEPLPVKRKPGRPRKVTTAQPPSESLAEPPVKRGRGRPRKSPIARPLGTPSEPLVKRGPGRPRKLTTAPPPESLMEPPVKRGPGRPRKLTTVPPPQSLMEPPVKRGPGRPRKVPFTATATATVTATTATATTTTTTAAVEAVTAAASKASEASVSEASDESASEASETSVSEASETSVSEASETSASEASEASVSSSVRRGRGRPPGSKIKKKSTGYGTLFLSSTDDERDDDSAASAFQPNNNYNYEDAPFQSPPSLKQGPGWPPESKTKKKSMSHDTQYPSNAGDYSNMASTSQSNYNHQVNVLQPPVKRKPGRPPGSKNKNKLFSADTPSFNNSIGRGSFSGSSISSLRLDNSDDDSVFQPPPPPPIKRKPGRPPGSKNKKKLFSLDASSLNNSTGLGSVSGSSISSLGDAGDNISRPLGFFNSSGHDFGNSSSWNLSQGYATPHPVKRRRSRGPSGTSTLPHSTIPLVIPNIDIGGGESSNSGGGPLFANDSNISTTPSFRRLPSPSSTYTRSVLNFYSHDDDIDTMRSDTHTFDDSISGNNMEIDSDTGSLYAQHGDRPPGRRTAEPTAYFRPDTAVDAGDEDGYAYNGDSGDDDDDYDYDTEDDSDASIQASQASAQFSTFSQYLRRPIQLGDHPPRAYTAPLPPSIPESETLFGDENDEDHDKSNDGELDRLSSHDTKDIDTAPRIVKGIDRSLHQLMERQQRQNKRHTLKRDTKRKKKEQQQQQWDRDARVARQMTKYLPQDDVDTAAVAENYRQQVRAERQRMHQEHLARSNKIQQRQKALADSNGLVWKEPLVSKPYAKRPKLRNKLTPTEFRKVTKVRETIIHIFVATLKENGIDELTEDHKLIMQDFYDDIEANLPLLEGESRLFTKALRWLTQDTKLANALRHSATKAKHILENLVWDMNLASEYDLSLADDESAGLAALQKQVDQGLGSVDAFLAKHSTPGNKDTAKEIDRYVLQLKKYPTSSIIQYKP